MLSFYKLELSDDSKAKSNKNSVKKKLLGSIFMHTAVFRLPPKNHEI